MGAFAFGDEMRVGLIGCVRRVWAPRGVKIEMPVEYQYAWAYLNLAVNGLTGLTGHLLWDWTENLKAESLAPVARGSADQGIHILVWDRARGHRGDAYQDVPIWRIEQLPYSPQLNIAERVFEYLRARIEGKIYGSIAAKKEAVERELRQLAQDPQQVQQLTGWEWIRQSVEVLLRRKNAA